MSGFVQAEVRVMRTGLAVLLLAVFILFSGAAMSGAQTRPQGDTVPGTVPGGPANVPGQGPNDIPGTGPNNNIPGTNPNDQIPGGGRIPERDRPPLGGLDTPKGGAGPGRDSVPVTPDNIISEPAAPEPKPGEPSSGGNVPPPVISDLPPLPDDPSMIQPELDTGYLTAPVFKDAVPVITDDAQYVPDQVVVLLRGASGKEAEIDGLGGRYDLDRLDSSPLSSLGVTMVLFRIPDGRAVPAVVNILAGDSAVLLSQPNYYYGSLAGENPQYGAVKIGADAVSDKATGSGITVAIIDTGIDYNHPALSGKVVEKADFVSPDMSGFTGESHGTSVAGIIAASAAEQEGGMSGVAPGVCLIAVRACWSDPGNNKKAVCSSEKLAKAIDFAVSKNAQVINLSVGGPKDNLIAALIQSAYGSGVTVVAAAGNGGAKGKPVYPAALNEVIAVSATDSRDGLYSFSTRGDYIDVAAPGVDILSPAPGGAWGMESGTSQAAAHVSGAVALLLQDYPELSPFQVKHLLGSSAVDLGKPGKDQEFGDGRIDVEKALDKLDFAGEASAR